MTRHDRGQGLRSQSGHCPPHPSGTSPDLATRVSRLQTHEEHQGRKSSRGPSAPCTYSSPNSSTTAEEEGHQVEQTTLPAVSDSTKDEPIDSDDVEYSLPKHIKYQSSDDGDVNYLPTNSIKTESSDDEKDSFAGSLADHDELFLQTVENVLRESALWYIDGSDAETPVADQGDADNEEPPVTARRLLQRLPTEDKSYSAVDITSPAARAGIARFEGNCL